MTRPLISVAAAGLAALIAAGSATAQTAAPGGGRVIASIAIVDAQQVLQKSQAALSIQKQLDAQREELTRSLVAQEEKLRAQEQDLAKQRASLSPEDFDVVRRDFEKQVAEVRRAREEHTRRLDLAFNEARNRLLDAIMGVVAEVARERGASIVVQRQAILYQADASLDISETVLQRLNAKLPQVTVNIPN